MSYLSTSVLAALLTVFAVSAWSKVHSYSARREFASSLVELRLFPDRAGRRVAGMLSTAETLLAIGLAWSLYARVDGHPGRRMLSLAVLVASGALLIALTVGIAISLRRGTGGRCACFGAKARPLSRRHVIRNVLLLVAAAAGVIAGSASRDNGRLAAGGLVVALAAGAFGGLLMVALDDVVDLFAPQRPSR